VVGPLGELLIPAIADVVQSVDLAAGRVVVRPLPGLLPGDD
jgi:ribosomal 30S subunit maturation factor RimM